MIDPTELYNRAMDAAEDWSTKDEIAANLDVAVDTLKAVIYAEMKSKGDSVTLIPTLAKGEKRYVEMMESYLKAKREALLAKMKYDQIGKYMDNIRTKESTRGS